MIEPPHGWKTDGNAWTKTFEHPGFDDAIAFVNAVAAEANRFDHHPDIAVRWNRVTIRTWSHDTGNVTDRDRQLAQAIDALAAAPTAEDV